MIIRTPAPVMAAGTAAAAATAATPWLALFLEHLSQMPVAMCAVSTLHPGEGGSSSVGPRVRTCVYRGLWAALPESAHNPAPRNPAGVYESDLPVFTTDARMAKAWELSASGEGQSQGKGQGIGGGPVEAVWWAAAAGTQWRIRGRAWLLGPDVEGAGAPAVARAAIARRMRTVRPAETSDWSWAREITAHYGNLRPSMRGSFRNPPPGVWRPEGPGGPARPDPRLGRPVADDDLDNAEARANFRVCVVVPEEVDQCDLSRDDDPRRWLYTYVGEGGAAVHEGGMVEGAWEKLEVWP